MCLNTRSNVVWKSPADPLHSDHRVISWGRSARLGRTERKRHNVRTALTPNFYLLMDSRKDGGSSLLSNHLGSVSNSITEMLLLTISSRCNSSQSVYTDLCELLQQLGLSRQFEEQTATLPHSGPTRQYLPLNERKKGMLLRHNIRLLLIPQL